MAIGASSAQVTGGLLRDGMRPAVLGVGMGLIAAIWLVKLLEALLFEISPLDPATWGGVTIALLAICAVASAVPARRAGAVQPSEVMRE